MRRVGYVIARFFVQRALMALLHADRALRARGR